MKLIRLLSRKSVVKVLSHAVVVEIQGETSRIEGWVKNWHGWNGRRVTYRVHRMGLEIRWLGKLSMCACRMFSAHLTNTLNIPQRQPWVPEPFSRAGSPLGILNTSPLAFHFSLEYMITSWCSIALDAILSQKFPSRDQPTILKSKHLITYHSFLWEFDVLVFVVSPWPTMHVIEIMRRGRGGGGKGTRKAKTK